MENNIENIKQMAFTSRLRIIFWTTMYIFMVIYELFKMYKWQIFIAFISALIIACNIIVLYMDYFVRITTQN